MKLLSPRAREQHFAAQYREHIAQAIMRVLFEVRGTYVTTFEVSQMAKTDPEHARQILTSLLEDDKVERLIPVFNDARRKPAYRWRVA